MLYKIGKRAVWIMAISIIVGWGFKADIKRTGANCNHRVETHAVPEQYTLSCTAARLYSPVKELYMVTHLWSEVLNWMIVVTFKVCDKEVSSKCCSKPVLPDLCILPEQKDYKMLRMYTFSVYCTEEQTGQADTVDCVLVYCCASVSLLLLLISASQGIAWISHAPSSDWPEYNEQSQSSWSFGLAGD